MATMQLRMAGTAGSSVCEICHRPLSDPESVKRGVGPVCAARMARQMAETEARDEEQTEADALLSQDLSDGIVIRRAPSGEVLTNVPRMVIHHSPTGFEFGYGGSGPADLALNILENVLKLEGYRGPRRKCFRGDCFSLAYALYQDFKWDFIATMDRDNGGKLEYQQIVHWIKERQAEYGLEE